MQQAIITPVPRGRSAALRARRRRPRTPDPTCWRDETTVRVKGRWCYLSRAINAAPANGITVTLTTGGTATLDTDYTLSSTTITLAEGPEADLGYGMLVGDRLVGMTSFGIEASVRQEPESVGRRSSKQCCTVKKSLTGQVYVCKTPRNHNRFCWNRGLHRPPIA